MAEALRRVDDAGAEAAHTHNLILAHRRHLSTRERRLAAVYAEIVADLERGEDLLRDAENREERYERELERLRAQIEVMRDTIRTLESANRSHLQRYDAEVAIQVRREVGAMPREM